MNSGYYLVVPQRAVVGFDKKPEYAVAVADDYFGLLYCTVEEAYGPDDISPPQPVEADSVPWSVRKILSQVADGNCGD